MLGLRRTAAPAFGPLANLDPITGCPLLWEVLEQLPEAVTLSVAVRDGYGAAVDMRLAFMNAQARAGQPDPDAALGRLCSELWPALVANGAFARCLAVLDTGEPVSGEFEWIDGTTLGGARDAAIAYRPVGYGYRAARVGQEVLVWVLRDRTDRLHTARELARSNADLAAFAQVVAHDLKTPLTSIIGNTELLGETADRPAHDRRQLDAIGRGAQWMATLIDGVLAYSRATRSAGPPVPVDPASVVREVLVDLAAEITHAQASVRVAPLPLVRVDPGQLHQLFQHLLGNALTFRRPGFSVQIVLGAAPGPAGSGLVELTVADNGVGVPAAARQRIFGLFARSADGGGRGGIGLATCARIVERCGGRIWVGDSPLGGAQFHVTLPAG
jgi:signal transduction histidine kinase